MSEFRRRMLLAANAVKKEEDDGMVLVEYDVTDTSAPTTILYTKYGVYAMKVYHEASNVWLDVPVATTYDWSAEEAGIKKVKFDFHERMPGGWNSGNFQGVSSIVSVWMTDLINFVGIYEFSGCTKLSKVKFSKNIVTMGYDVFLSNPIEGELNLPLCTTIGGNTFHGSRFTKVDMDAIQTISGGWNQGAFMNNTSLKEVRFGKNLTSLGAYCFSGCRALEKLTIEAVTPPSFGGSIFSVVPDIYVPAESVDAYKAASGWSSYASKIKAI